jgi:hypothetical protein
MIKTVIKSADGMVMVFDKMEEQIPQYQGQHKEVKALILKDAPPKARFGCFPNGGQELRIVPEKEW